MTDEKKQVTSSLVNLLQFLCHTYHPHPKPANKSHEKATLNRLASHALCDASQPI